jgi:transcriptional regulator with PAS, ATPase and Fis domain
MYEQYGIPIIGDSARMHDVYQFVSKIAVADCTVLIRGESGTGKELVARAIHRNSPRADRPFVAINCALNEMLVENELFGHEPGAFTGATAQKKGKIEIADVGTLFLDEIGALALPLQAKLLRALQERKFDRVGGTRPIRMDIRLIAASNRNLEEAVKANLFHQYFFYRLGVITLTLPPLRDRREDIPLLATHFLRKYTTEIGRDIQGFSQGALKALLTHDWPGNVRQLQQTISFAVVRCQGNVIRADDLNLGFYDDPGEEGGSLVAE